MANTHISVQVFQEFEGLVSGPWLRHVAECALALEPERPSSRRIGTPTLMSEGAVSLVIADDETVRDLNQRHRGLNENTDVLAFSFSHQGEYYGDGQPSSAWSEDVEFVMPPGDGLGLGEVIISYPQAVRQAWESERTTARELATLLAHGVLHLLGYDHMGSEEEAAMKAKEAEVLAQVLRKEE